MNTIDNILMNEQTKIFQHVAEQTEKAKEVTDAIHRKYTDGVIQNITEHFGKHLISCLGSPIASNRNITIIPELCDPDNTEVGRYASWAKKHGFSSAEDYLVANPSRRSGDRLYTHLAVGSGLGFSMYNGQDGRTFTKAMSADSIFRLIHKDHAKLIKDKHRRECCEEFIQFRDDFVSEANSNPTVCIPINMQVVGKYVRKYNVEDAVIVNYYNRKIAGYVMSTDVPVVIEWAYLVIPHIPKHDYTNQFITSSTMIGNGREYNDNQISLQLFSTIPDSDTCSFYGCFEFDYEKHTNPVMTTKAMFDGVASYNGNYTEQLRGSRTLSTSNKDLGFPPDVVHPLKDRGVSVSPVVVTDWYSVLTHPMISQAIDNKIAMFSKYSVRLQELKEKYAHLFLLHSTTF